MPGGISNPFAGAFGTPSLPPGILSWEDDDGVFHAIVADIAVALDVSRDTVLSKHALEDGTDITDHVTQGPNTIKVTIKQTQTPILESDEFSFQTVELPSGQNDIFEAEGLLLAARAISGAVGAVGDFLGLTSGSAPVKAHVLKSDSDEDRITALQEELEKVQRDVKPITVSTAGNAYPRYIITRLVYSRQGPELLGTFEIEAEQIRTVSTQAAEGLPNPADLRMKPQENRGKKPAPEVQSAVEERSLLASAGLGDLVAGLF